MVSDSAALSDGGFGFPREKASAIVGIYAACVYLASLPGGWIADRIDRFYRENGGFLRNSDLAGFRVDVDPPKLEEERRLFYVGITRAVSHCYWYVEPQDTQAVNMPRASDRVAKGKPFFVDHRPEKKTA